MKVIIKKVHEKVQAVTLMSHYPNKTETEILQRIEEINNTDKHVHWSMEEIDGDVAEAFRFLLGESDYKVTHSIDTLMKCIEEVQDELENIKHSIDCIDVPTLFRNVEELKDIIEKEK